jgi:hypothetical protein
MFVSFENVYVFNWRQANTTIIILFPFAIYLNYYSGRFLFFRTF